MSKVDRLLLLPATSRLHTHFRNDSGVEPLFVSNRGDRLSADAVERIVRKQVELASDSCPTFEGKRVTPHVLRHIAAMQLLQERRGPHVSTSRHSPDVLPMVMIDNASRSATRPPAWRANYKVLVIRVTCTRVGAALFSGEVEAIFCALPKMMLGGLGTTAAVLQYVSPSKMLHITVKGQKR